MQKFWYWLLKISIDWRFHSAKFRTSAYNRKLGKRKMSAVYIHESTLQRLRWNCLYFTINTTIYYHYFIIVNDELQKVASLCFKPLQNTFFKIYTCDNERGMLLKIKAKSDMKAHMADEAQSEANDSRQNPNLLWIALSVLVWTWMNILTFKPNCLERANHKRTSRKRVHVKASN